MIVLISPSVWAFLCLPYSYALSMRFYYLYCIVIVEVPFRIYYQPEVRRGKYLGLGSISVAILPSCQYIKNIALSMHKYDIVG